MDPNSQNQGWGDGVGTNPQNVLQAENYIRQNSGTYSVEQIKEVLKNSGYGNVDINQAMANVFPTGQVQPGGFNQVGYQGQGQAVATGNVSMNIGSLLSSSFQFLKANIIKLTLIYILGMLAFIPFSIKFEFDIYNLLPGSGSAFGFGDPITLALLALGIVGVILSTMATTNYIVQSHKGESIGVIGAYSSVMPFFFSYLFLTILTLIFVFLGIMALVIPGIIIAIYLVFAPFTFFDEGFRGMGAIKRSYELAKGDGLNIFLNIFLAVLVMFFAMLILGVTITFLGNIGEILNLIVNLAFGIFFNIFMFQLYRAVKFKKTGTV